MKNRGGGGQLLLTRNPRRIPAPSERSGIGHAPGVRFPGKMIAKRRRAAALHVGAGHYQSSSWAASSGAALLLGLPSARASASSSILAMRRFLGFLVRQYNTLSDLLLRLFLVLLLTA